MRLLSTFLSIVLIFVAAPVRADVSVAHDHKSGASLVYPDTWKRGVNQLSDEKIVINAPGAERASCRLRVREDKRFNVYPVRYGLNIQRVAVSDAFWDDYLSGYHYAEIIRGRDDGGMGRGFASWVEISFISDTGPKIHRRGLAMASIYNGQLYVAECSTVAARFTKWYKPFMKVLGSVSFKKGPHELPSGHYRNFLSDSDLLVHGKKSVDVYVY